MLGEREVAMPKIVGQLQLCRGSPYPGKMVSHTGCSHFQRVSILLDKLSFTQGSLLSLRDLYMT